MGIALSTQNQGLVLRYGEWQLTLVEHVAQRAIVQNHNLAQVRLYRAQILDVGAVPVCTVLTVVSTREEFTFLF